jgi:hypothetical protein
MTIFEKTGVSLRPKGRVSSSPGDVDMTSSSCPQPEVRSLARILVHWSTSKSYNPGIRETSSPSV